MFAIAGTRSVGAGLASARGTLIRLRSGQAVRTIAGVFVGLYLLDGTA